MVDKSFEQPGVAGIARHLERQGPYNPFPGVRALERRLGRSLDHQLVSNEGLDMPHRALRRRFGGEVADLARCYGDAEALALRQCLSAQLDTSVDNLLVDAGADSLIALCLRALCDTGSTVVTSGGTYPTFAYFAEGHGCRLVEVPYHSAPDCLMPDLEGLASAAQRQAARVVYLANPDNPSGYYHSHAAVQGLRAALPPDCTLILDEAYHDFRPDTGDSRSLPGVIRLRTFSKAHGLAGLRIGYTIAAPETLGILYKVRIHYAVSSLSLAAAETVLDHADEVRAHVRGVIECREQLARHLRVVGAEVLPSAANFVTVRLPDDGSAGAVHQAMLRAGTAIHHPPHPALRNVLRITALQDALAPDRLTVLERVLPG